MAASNGWFPWHADNDDHITLRLVSKGVKQLVDQPWNGGADFEKIWDLLDNRNRFDLIADYGYCAHCRETDEDAPEEQHCETCAGRGEYENCCCKKDHRWESVVRMLDPRLNKVTFQAMPLRERVQKLFRFHRWCVSNFLKKKEFNGSNADLTEIDSMMWEYHLPGGLCFEMKQYNKKTYTFMHNLLFIGWAHKGLSLSAMPPGTDDPYRPYLLGQEDDYWHGWHRETFAEIYKCFIECQRPAPGENPLEPDEWEDRQGHGLKLSQIQYIPETIRRCVENSWDTEAVSLLGNKLASSIDLYRPARATLRKYEGTGELDIKWMPGLGMPKEAYTQLSSYKGYNPQSDHILCTGLQTVLEPVGQEEGVWERNKDFSRETKSYLFTIRNRQNISKLLQSN